MGSKYLGRAPSGLRIVILSKGSCVSVGFVVIFKQLCSKNGWRRLVGEGDCGRLCWFGWVFWGIEEERRKGGRRDCAARARVLTGWWLSPSANA